MSNRLLSSFLGRNVNNHDMIQLHTSVKHAAVLIDVYNIDLVLTIICNN